MPAYIISTHGNPDWQGLCRVPASTQVLFYQPFGREMDNQMGFLLQSALANPSDPRSRGVLNRYASVALWNGGAAGHSYKPEVELVGDNVAFYTGIVRVDEVRGNEIVYRIPDSKRISLSEALQLIRSDADRWYGAGTMVTVHSLFCLGPT